MRPVILVGRRADGGQRDRVWKWCVARWIETLGWPIFEGHHHDGVWNMPVASNLAARVASETVPDWDVALYVGADWMVENPMQARLAVELALESGQLTFAHNAASRLDETQTSFLVADAVALPTVAAEGEQHRNTFSGVLAVPRTLWEKVGGFDERFVGWGWEDLAFWSACWAIGGDFHRVSGRIVHLWHPWSWETNEGAPEHPANQVLGERYLAAKTSRPAMLKILAERS